MAEQIQLGFSVNTAQLTEAEKSLQRLNTYLQHMGDVGTRTARKTKETSEGIGKVGIVAFQAGQAVQDFAIGMERGLGHAMMYAGNNISFIASMLGVGAALQVGLQVASTGVMVLAQNWERLAEAISKTPKSELETLKALNAPAGSPIADFVAQTEGAMGSLKGFGVNRDKAPELGQAAAQAIGKMTERVDRALVQLGVETDDRVREADAKLEAARRPIQLGESAVGKATTIKLAERNAEEVRKAAEGTVRERLARLTAAAQSGDVAAINQLANMLESAGFAADAQLLRESVDKRSAKTSRDFAAWFREADFKVAEMMYGPSPQERRERERQDGNATDALNLGAEMRGERIRREIAERDAARARAPLNEADRRARMGTAAAAEMGGAGGASDWALQAMLATATNPLYRRRGGTMFTAADDVRDQMTLMARRRGFNQEAASQFATNAVNAAFPMVAQAMSQIPLTSKDLADAIKEQNQLTRDMLRDGVRFALGRRRR